MADGRRRYENAQDIARHEAIENLVHAASLLALTCQGDQRDRDAAATVHVGIALLKVIECTGPQNEEKARALIRSLVKQSPDSER